MTRVLIIGGYGNFGRYISTQLAKQNNIQIIVAGRSLHKAQQLTDEIDSCHPAEAFCLDYNIDLKNSLAKIKPNIVIHTSGPFQVQNYDVAIACIEAGIHYIDLADGREFVSGISQLDALAKQHQVLAISGASSVPCFTSALIDHYLTEFSKLTDVEYAITTAQKTTRGLATTAAILGYTGKAFTALRNAKLETIYGWQDLHRHTYSQLGKRFLSNCDIPDLSLFPERYPDLNNIKFYAGLEIPLIHIGLWSLSWLVRAGLIRHLDKMAPLLLRLSFLFDHFGSANSGFHMQLSGTDQHQKSKTIYFELTAGSGDGPYIPCMPSILLTRKIANGENLKTGAGPCMGYIHLSEYLNALSALDINWHENIIETKNKN